MIEEVSMNAHSQCAPQVGDVVRTGFQLTRKSTDLIRIAYITPSDKVLSGHLYIGRHCLGGTGTSHDISPLQPGDMDIWNSHAGVRPD